MQVLLLLLLLIATRRKASHWSTSDFGNKLKWRSDSQCRRFIMVPIGRVAK